MLDRGAARGAVIRGARTATSRLPTLVPNRAACLHEKRKRMLARDANLLYGMLAERGSLTVWRCPRDGSENVEGGAGQRRDGRCRHAGRRLATPPPAAARLRRWRDDVDRGFPIRRRGAQQPSNGLLQDDAQPAAHRLPDEGQPAAARAARSWRAGTRSTSTGGCSERNAGTAALRAARRPAVRERRHPHRARAQQGAQGLRRQVPHDGRAATRRTSPAGTATACRSSTRS